MRKLLAMTMMLLALGVLLASGGAAPVAAQNQNLLRNPGFEGNYNSWLPQYATAQVADEWTPWWIDDPSQNPIWAMPEWKPAVRQFYPTRVFEGDRAQQWFSFFKSHNAGMYQQVTGVTPGVTYRFSVMVQVWSSESDVPFPSVAPGNPHFQIGIDPTGAARPGRIGASPDTVVWSSQAPMERVIDQWYAMSIDVVARSSTITVYMRSNPQWAVKHNDIYVDAARLVAVSTAPAPQQPTPLPQPPAPVDPNDPCAIPPSGPWPCADPSGPWTPGYRPPTSPTPPAPTDPNDPCAIPPSGPWPCADPRGPWA